MARSVASISFGNDYHYRFFWLQACRLFEERSKVTSVEIEAQNIKSLDDVAVHYNGMLDYGKPVISDYYQIKFHVTAAGAFTWKSMMDPAFIGADSVSLLKRVHNAQVKYAPDGTGCRFYVYSPWNPHPDDMISRLISQTDGRIRWDVLSQGGDRSEAGKVRASWRKHLGLTSVDELQKVLTPLRLQTGLNLENLGDTLNLRLRIAGLREVPAGSMIHPYEELAKRFIQSGTKKLTRNDIERICKSEGLWVGNATLEPDTRRLGIRSFSRFAEYLEDETDQMLCLLRHFEGRIVRSPEDWNEIIVPEVLEFLRANVKPGQSYLLYLPTHASIAFLTGWHLGTKSGANVALIQTGMKGREIWRPGLSAISNDDWQHHSINMNTGGKDSAIAISITHNVEKEVVHFVKKQLPSVDRILCCQLANLGNASIRDGIHASSLAVGLTQILKEQRNASESSAMLHVFLAAPNSFAFFLGQLSTGLGPVTLYEYDFEKGVEGAYSKSVILPPTKK